MALDFTHQWHISLVADQSPAPSRILEYLQLPTQLRQKYCNIFFIPHSTPYNDSLSVICPMVFWLCDECKLHYIPNIFRLSPQLMRMQSEASIARRNVIEIKHKKLFKNVYVFWNWNCIKSYESNNSDTTCFNPMYIYIYIYILFIYLFSYLLKLFAVTHTMSI
jgi:hypothetical protein